MIENDFGRVENTKISRQRANLKMKRVRLEKKKEEEERIKSIRGKTLTLP